ncbi:F-box/LRR-repeat protein At3g03360 isoform X1 [Eucalyptus grandis]|uniref:F-box/LRR-repeat protein At3g03360 isoform X1 n=2 Tax=Eucalyptus grandis TaxID=71139 RepID=UPI000525B27F|nr:F-box/LRR-repeat protein At3g03360 isoform X1 [Eucalyptus grandis]XP_010057494.1 F-box/LRR-repeat protein At3g03360 isoform X1 [Eucalyptus grandis]XP_010057495.1 F-box/LRR-repeat protein At3g03360 isoform X1 [Eucalyptus grandis]XP_010057496.1 F-box/LRR-repeat protein At3g03360 isoform X1 [Eucalyptus grandis]XP_018730204.1 F-box/LRR-repeat protein At3g03360 isoform X1 [Eucalyptus grandis]XP_018730205.1 F-box/LRR-repeat protein At3g03360 isoform X1 [Eucalyptus grandis]XP_039168489.1 F-box/LR
MLLMETEHQSTIPNALPFNSAGNSSEDSAVKRARLLSSNQDETQNAVDYISQLPDAIIVHIFSFLTTKDTVKTSVLSKQWRSTWTSSQYMSFSLPPGGSRKSKGFIAFVNSVQSRYTSDKLKRFLFDAPCLALMRSSLDRWLQFAVEHDVEELSVTLNYRRHKIYALPQILFCCKTLVSLHISRCCFGVCGTVNWCSLKILHIEHAKLNDDGLMRVLSGSPVLEFLELKSCVGIKHIMVESKIFRELVIDSHEFRGQASMLKISAPHLLKLRLLGNSRGGEFRLDEVSSLIEAELNFNMKICALDKVKAHADLLKGLLKRLHHVTKLVMGSWCIQVLSLMEARDIFLPSLECRHLILLGAAGHEGVPEAIAKILESTRLLEKLYLQTTCTPNPKIELNAESTGCHIFAGEEFWNFVKWRIYQCLMHLKHVEIVDCGANPLPWEPVISLLKFLLQNALWLDKIVINSPNSKSSQAFEPSPLLEVARILLSHPKCSPRAKVIFRYPFQGCPPV